MTTAARLALPRCCALVFSIGLWLYGAPASVAHAGFELSLDTSSLRQNGDHYSIDVLFKGSETVNLFGIITKLTSQTPGLKFLDVVAPDDEDVRVFNATADYQEDGVSSGVANELWEARVVDVPNPVLSPSEGIAFRLDFSVPGSGTYDIDIVDVFNTDTQASFYLHFGGENMEEPLLTPFDTVRSDPFVIVSTPEPSSLALLATALGGLGVWRWRPLRIRASMI